jgi:hypothetical protein
MPKAKTKVTYKDSEGNTVKEENFETDIPDLDNLEALKIEKLTPEQILEKYKSGGYTSYGIFYNEHKDQIDLQKHQLRSLLIENNLYVPKKRGSKETEETGEPSISSKEFYRLFFNEFLGKEINTSDIPRGRKKWVYSEDELNLLGSVTDPVLPKIELPKKIQNWIKFGIVMFTLVIPRFVAQVREKKEIKGKEIARSTQEPESK